MIIVLCFLSLPLVDSCIFTVLKIADIKFRCLQQDNPNQYGFIIIMLSHLPARSKMIQRFGSLVPRSGDEVLLQIRPSGCFDNPGSCSKSVKYELDCLAEMLQPASYLVSDDLKADNLFVRVCKLLSFNLIDVKILGDTGGFGS